MENGRFDEILSQARQQLSRDEQLKLARTLLQSAPNGDSPNAQKSLYEVLQERGLIGSITDAPSDLGTNPKHLEGFGRDD